MGCDHFFTVLSLHGNHPSMPTYLCRQTGGDFLRLAAHEGVRGGRSIPNFHSVSDRCRRPHPVLCSLNAGQSALNLCFKDTSRPAKSQSVAKKRGAESPVSLRALPLVRALFPQRDTHGGLQRLESSPLEIIPFTLRVTMGA